jgi:hypothetical protein
MTFFSQTKTKKKTFPEKIVVKGAFLAFLTHFCKKVTFFGKIAFFRKVRILVKGGPNML